MTARSSSQYVLFLTFSNAGHWLPFIFEVNRAKWVWFSCSDGNKWRKKWKHKFISFSVCFQVAKKTQWETELSQEALRNSLQTQKKTSTSGIHTRKLLESKNNLQTADDQVEMYLGVKLKVYGAQCVKTVKRGVGLKTHNVCIHNVPSWPNFTLGTNCWEVPTNQCAQVSAFDRTHLHFWKIP